jgi:hypothetical protein
MVPEEVCSMEREPRPPDTADPGTELVLSPQAVSMLTTEHFTLQSAQGQEISDINGRTALFIGAVSSALIALAFIGQLSRLGTPFYVFVLVLFPSLILMGLVTFERVIQSTYAVITYARGINRLRHLYLEYAPQIAPYFILSTHDDAISVTRGVGIRPTWWQIFLITPGMIAMLVAVLIGTFAAMLCAYLFGWSLATATGIGVLAFCGSLTLLQLHHWQQFQRTERRVPTRFPSVAQQRHLP